MALCTADHPRLWAASWAWGMLQLIYLTPSLLLLPRRRRQWSTVYPACIGAAGIGALLYPLNSPAPYLAPMSTADSIDYDNLTLVDAVAHIHSGRLTSHALMTETLRRASALPSLGAFTSLTPTPALATALCFDQQSTPRPLLAGVPLLVKDNIHTSGFPNTAGTPALHSFHPSTDAPIVARLRAAGAIPYARATLHELAWGVSGYTSLVHIGGEGIGVRNAYDRRRVAGGSSSGCGAALGARAVQAALGTDTGGSIRVPCALNGVCGLRPTWGRWPQEGVTPCALVRDTAGPMAQSMADVELLDRVVMGEAGGVELEGGLKGVRVGVLKQMMEDLDADTEVVMRDALSRMHAAGMVLVDLDEPALFPLCRRISMPLSLYHSADDLAEYLARYVPHLSVEQLVAHIASPDVRALYKTSILPRRMPLPDGTSLDLSTVHEQALSEGRPELTRMYEELMRERGVVGLVFPTVPEVAWPADEEASGMQTFQRVVRNVQVGSVVGCPGITLPVALGPRTGLPVSLGVDGVRGSDRALLALGIALQESIYPRLPPPAWVADAYRPKHEEALAVSG